MDLGIIFWKLKDQTYKSIQSFFGDLHLVMFFDEYLNTFTHLKVWRNCQTFNQQGSPVYEASVKLNSLFETWWNRSQKQLSVGNGKYDFVFRPEPEADGIKDSEPTGRSRRSVPKRSFDSNPAEAATSVFKVTGPTIKIKLGSRGFKREHASKSKSEALFGKYKEKSLDAETIRNLDVCISILEKVLQTGPAMTLENASLQATFVPSLSELCESLKACRQRNWIRSPYLSSKDVLQEAGLFLRSQAVRNKNKKRIVTCCQELLKTLERMWAEAELWQDVETIKESLDEGVNDGSNRGESNLRITKARVEKLKRQEMEKEVEEAEHSIAVFEETKKAIEDAKARLDKTKESLKEMSKAWNSEYKVKLFQLEELNKSKTQAQKQKEKALAAIQSSQARSFVVS